MEETLYDYWLMNIDQIGSVSIKRLTDFAGSAHAVWDMTEAELSSPCLKLKKNQIAALTASKDEGQVIAAYNKLSARGISFIAQRDPLFPKCLKEIAQAPEGIYLKGLLPDPSRPSAAIVGARNCSDYGRYVTRKISSCLVENGFQIISGLAMGIDVIAQKAALDAGGYSCGVLGCGADICYPAENRETYDRLIQSGGIISEYAPGTPPKAGFFPMRNRIISALSDIVVVIEAREKSGSLITADLALEQGKDIYALPGRVTDSLSHGCNRLIRQGAGIILSPEEFVNDLAVNYSLHADIPGAAAVRTDKTDGALTESEKKLMLLIGFDPVSISELQSGSGLPFPLLMDSLMSLSMKGKVNQDGGYYTRG